jgi:hypothetical protein
LLCSDPAAALESSAAITFGERSYSYTLDIADIPPCPGLLETLFRLDTMRRLMPFVDSFEVLEEQGNHHVVRVAFGALGFHTALTYERLLEPEPRRIQLRLLEREGSLPLVSFPSAFEAGYELGEGPVVRYRQDATVGGRASLPHQLFVRAQLSLFEHRMLGIIEDACPASAPEG